jgi:hypothetical protein
VPRLTTQGVLKWLAEQKRLDKVVHISSVSGGSLLVGLVFQLAGYRWPTSEQYLDEIFPKIRKILTGKSLQTSALTLRYLPKCLNRKPLIGVEFQSNWRVWKRYPLALSSFANGSKVNIIPEHL